MNMKRFGLMLLWLALLPGVASAWWEDDWGFKKKISIDKQRLAQDTLAIPGDALALVRLHSGNFMAFAELAEGGRDIRVLAEDEATPLKFFIEKMDQVNELAFIWVRLPKELAASPEPAFWLYFGNERAVDAQDAAGTHDVNQVLSYQFGAQGVRDSTAYGNHPSEVTATSTEASLIGYGVLFQDGQIIRIPASPTLQMAPANGWTLSAWLRIDQDQANAVLAQRTGGAGAFTLAINGQSPVLEIKGQAGEAQVLPSKAVVTPGVWHHLAVAATAENVALYLDGVAVDTFQVKTPELTGDLTIGADSKGARGFVGALDQLTLHKVARDANAIKFDAVMQGSGSALLVYGDELTPEGEGEMDYITATLQNVTRDGWVVIGLLAIMFLISVLVMVSKTIVLNKVHSENRRFEEAFRKLGTEDLSDLNVEETEDDQEFEESPLLFSLASNHGHFSASSIYRIYHVGIDEMNKRLRGNGGNGQRAALSAGSMAAVKASMDAVMVREMQKLNSQMVLLTIAISGGPFLGLLGTVIGVMVTFTAIAVAGEVNVNTIAPGIAGALSTTVVGLVVAIPSLFGYNYLGGRINIIAADMQVFVDEFVAKLAEDHT